MQVAKIIDAPLETVWQILVDTRLWPLWGSSIIAVDCPQRWIAQGVEGWVKTALRIWLPFKISSFDAPLCWNWDVAGIPATGHRLQRLGADRCELIFEVPYGIFFYAAICRRAMENIARLARERNQA